MVGVVLNAYFGYVLMLFKDELNESNLETEQSSSAYGRTGWRVIAGREFQQNKSLYLPVTSQDLDSIGQDDNEMNYESSRRGNSSERVN